MKIHSCSNSISFKAHFYNVQVKPVTNNLSIETDNKPNLGNVPTVVSENLMEIPMSKTNSGYATDYKPFYTTKFLNYKIHYKDTNNIETKNGKNYLINIIDLFNKAIVVDKKLHKQPLEMVLAKGNLSGKLIDLDKYMQDETFDIDSFEKELDDPKKPVIILSKEISFGTGIIYLHKQYCLLNNKEFRNIFHGFICTETPGNTLGHFNSSIRNNTDMSTIILDKNKTENLKKLDGKYIDASTLNGHLEFKEISKENVKQIKETSTKIQIPKMKNVEHLIELKDYEINTVGPKAYKLKIMQDLVDKGKLDVTIPDSFVVPNGHIEKMYKGNKHWNEEAEKEYKKGIEHNKSDHFIKEALSVAVILDEDDISQTKDILQMLKKKGWENKSLKVRSSFNGEDIPNYSAAGLYDSYSGMGLANITGCIYMVNASKWNEKAYTSRMLNNIPHDDIKASVIIQEEIDNPDYTFTIYTKTPNKDNNTAYMEMHSRDKTVENMRDPYRIEYNKDTKSLDVISTERTVSNFKFDESGDLIESSINNDRLAENKSEMYPLLENVMKNALVLEKELGPPQDIEGGIKDGKIYFWQTRNIVK